jgi:hypothetical protein
MMSKLILPGLLTVALALLALGGCNRAAWQRGLAGAAQGAAATKPVPPPQPASAPTVTCFGRGEATSGSNKICYYDCLGSAAAITIPAVSLCPLTIQH